MFGSKMQVETPHPPQAVPRSPQGEGKKGRKNTLLLLIIQARCDTICLMCEGCITPRISRFGRWQPPGAFFIYYYAI